MATKRSEEVEAVLRELEAWGLEGTPECRSKHVIVRWATPGGRTFATVCAATGSDIRGPLNARAQVRRQIKDAGLTRPVPVYRKLERALKLPEPGEDLPTRVERLEKEVGELLSLVFELKEKLDQKPLVTREAVLAQITAATSGQKPKTTLAVPTPAQVVAPQKPRLPHNRDRVLSVIGTSWTSRSFIMQRSGVSHNSLSPTLTILKGLGLIEIGERGYYRRTQAARTIGVGATAVECVV